MSLIRAVYLTILYMLVGILVNTGAAMISMDFYIAHRMLWTFLSAMITIPFCLIQMNTEGYLEWERQRRKENGKADWIFLVLLGASSCVALNYWIGLSGLMEVFSGFDEVAETIYTGNLLEEFLAIVLAAPVVEELLFRGLAYRGFCRLWGPRTAMFASALFFGIYHRNVVQGLYAFLLGLLLVSVYESFGTIRASIVFHMAANAISLVLTECVDMGWVKQSLLIELMFTISFTVVAVLAFAMLRRRKNQIQNKEKWRKEN